MAKTVRAARLSFLLPIHCWTEWRLISRRLNARWTDQLHDVLAAPTWNCLYGHYTNITVGGRRTGARCLPWQPEVADGKKTDICIASRTKNSPLKHSGMDHTAFTLQTHHTCLCLVSVHQTAPPVVIAAIWLQFTTYLSTPWGWKAKLAPQLADLQWTVYPYKWLPISCRSGAGQGKFAGQRPTFDPWATPLINSDGRNFPGLAQWLTDDVTDRTSRTQQRWWSPARQLYWRR